MNNHPQEQQQQQQQQPPTSNWSDLTYECLLNILTRLTLQDRWLGPMLVCKSWLHASKDPSLHTVFDLESLFKSRPSESSHWWSREFERRMDDMIMSVVEWSDGGVVDIKVRHCSDRALSLVAQRCPNLEVLSIKSCANVTDESMIKLAAGCPKLKEVDISYCYEISHESLDVLGRKCTNISTLKRNLMNSLDPSQHIGIVPTSYLNACPQDGDSEAAAIGKCMPQIRHLELRFSKLSARGLALITDGCKNLEYLDLSGCMNVSNRDITNSTSSLTNLKNVKKPNFYIPRAGYNAERYNHWSLYDDRFQTDAFRF